MGRKLRWAAVSAASVVAVAAVGIVATSSSGSAIPVNAGNTVASKASAKSASASAAAVVAMAKKALQQDYAGTDRSLPKTGPKAAKNRSVWIISCTQSGAGCELPANAAEAAGKLMGWNMTVADGQYNPTVYNEDIREAIAANANAIILVAIDCADVEGSLAAAHAAGIKVFGLYSFDCSAVGKPNEFNGSINYGPWGGYKNYVENSYAKAIADYAIAKTNGHAQIIELRSNDIAIVQAIDIGFNKEIAKCKGCTVYTKVFNGAEFLGGDLQSYTSEMLDEHPNATVVFAPYDAAILLGMGAAVQQAEAAGSKLILLGGEGLPPNIALIREGVQTAAFGLPSTWGGWAAIDGLNRVFHGDPQVDEGIGHQTIDLQHNLPAVGQGYDGNARSQGFMTNLERIWGV
jgi:ribose transport system substrate-binding protein